MPNINLDFGIPLCSAGVPISFNETVTPVSGGFDYSVSLYYENDTSKMYWMNVRAADSRPIQHITGVYNAGINKTLYTYTETLPDISTAFSTVAVTNSNAGFTVSMLGSTVFQKRSELSRIAPSPRNNTQTFYSMDAQTLIVTALTPQLIVLPRTSNAVGANGHWYTRGENNASVIINKPGVYECSYRVSGTLGIGMEVNLLCNGSLMGSFQRKALVATGDIVAAGIINAGDNLTYELAIQLSGLDATIILDGSESNAELMIAQISY